MLMMVDKVNGGGGWGGGGGGRGKNSKYGSFEHLLLFFYPYEEERKGFML